MPIRRGTRRRIWTSARHWPARKGTTRLAHCAQRSRVISAPHGGNALQPGNTEAFLKYRTPLAPSLDGNTVDAQLEQAAFADNAVRYQATLTFLTSKFKSLMTAITGQ